MGELLGRATREPATNRASGPGAEGEVIQRKLKFKPGDLGGDLSWKAKTKGRIGKESTYSKIQKALDAYWAVPDGAGFEAEQAARRERLAVLRTLDVLCRNWLTADAANKKATGRDVDKRLYLERLATAVTKELRDEEYKQKYQLDVKPGVQQSLLESTTNQFALTRVTKRELKQGQKTDADLTDAEAVKLWQYTYLKKKLGLTGSEIAAIQMYTGDQYELMNPAQAGIEPWLASNLAKHTQTAGADRGTALDVNRELGDYASAGLAKFPDWEQKRGVKLYRGETVPLAEGPQLVAGHRKRFPHLLSTSKALDTPRSQIGSWTTEARPFQVIYHIVDSSRRRGKDVEMVAKSGKGEAEILFPAGTTFVITKVLIDKPEKNYREVEVVTE